jgi:hypothetical protein
MAHGDAAEVWARAVLFAWPDQEPQPVMVGETISSQAIHALMHTDELRAIRAAHNR